MKKGFTLLELIIVLALIVIISAAVLANLGGQKNDSDLTATTQQIGTLLRQAQNDAMAQESDTAWGVHFANPTGTAPSYTLFETSYAPSTIVDGPYFLPPTVAFVTSTIASGATLDVIFSSITGTASVSTTIGLYMPDENTALSSTISIASSGSVSY